MWASRRALEPELDALRRSGAGRTTAAGFVERHAPELDAATRRHEGVMARIAGDSGFVAYLAAQAASAG